MGCPPCRLNETKQQKAYLTAQRLGRGQVVFGEDQGCVNCPHLQVLIDKIVEQQNKLKEMADHISEIELPFSTV